jgi:signal transduction histidine kinase
MIHLLKKLCVVVGLAVLMLAGGIWWWKSRGSAKLSFTTAIVKRGDVVATIGATGTIEPLEVVDVGAQVAGRIRLFGTDRDGQTVDYGSVVEEGALLAKIDESVYAADLSVAKARELSAVANLEQMNAKLDQAAGEWKRAQALFESKLTKEQHAVVEAMQEMGKLFPPQDHLSEFSQCGVELADPGCSEFGLLKVVELSIEPFANEAKKENIVIASLVHQDVPALVTGCEARLRRVLAHFIDSSVQFTKVGSVIVSVTKESETQSQLVLKFSVKGGNHDLSEESQRQLLKTCSQTGELGPGNYTALELGLAAAKKLVEMMVDADLAAEARLKATPA